MKNRPLAILISVFFFWGFVAASNTILIGLFKKNFELSQFQSQLVDWAFYMAYAIGAAVFFLISFIAGDPLNKIGYKKGLILGLIISAIGALGFIPAAMNNSFPLMLTGLFTIALGFALQQIVANPYVMALGSPETGAHRNMLAGGINSFGTTIGPLLLAFAVYGNIAGSPAYLERGSDKLEIDLSIERTTGNSETVKANFLNYSDSTWPSTKANTYYFGVTESQVNSVYQSLVEKNSGGLVFSSLGSDTMTQRIIGNLKKKFPGKHIPLLHLNLDEKSIWALSGAASNTDTFIEVKYYGVDSVIIPSLILACAFLLFALILGMSKLPPITNSEKMAGDLGALRYPQIWLGMLAIFVYVGTEVTIQSNLPEYMRKMFGRESGTTVHFISLYWGSLMIGRWVGALTVFNLKGKMKTLLTIVVPILVYGLILLVNYIKGSPMEDLLKYIPFIGIIIVGFFMAAEKPARTMILFGLMAAVMMGLGILLNNEWSTYCFVSGGLFCSVMWPCIFSLAIAGLGKYTTQGSSLLIMMILGGAIIPPLQGLISDGSLGIHYSYIVPLIGFLFLAWFGYKVRKVLVKQGIDYDKTVDATH
ncbi:MAG: MFS transporter [Bacteroidota bacterium]|nr:MFS transporter [Bacteroidota bacterium]